MLEQLESCPRLAEALGFLVGEGAGLRGRRLPRRGRARGGRADVLVATSDRDAFQLASDRVTILAADARRQRARADRARRGARALRRRARAGAGPDRAPRRPVGQAARRPGIGPKKAARSLGQYGTLEAALAAGRFAAEAEDLRLYRRIATNGRLRSLPPLDRPDTNWAEASSFFERARARAALPTELAARCRAAIDVLTHPASRGCTRRRPPGAARAARGARSRNSSTGREGAPASEDEVLLCHTRGATSTACARSTSRDWLDGDTIAHRDDATRRRCSRAGTAIEAARARRLRARAAARATTRSRAARWASASSTTSPSRRGTRRRARARARRDRRLGRPPRQRHARRSSGDDDTVLFVSLHQWPFYPGSGGPDDQARDDAQRPAAGRLGRRGVPRRRSTTRVEPAVRAFEPELVLVSAGFDAHARDPLADMRVTEDGFRELARRCAALGAARRRGARGRLRPRDAAGLVEAALEGFSVAESRTGPARAGRRFVPPQSRLVPPGSDA